MPVELAVAQAVPPELQSEYDDFFLGESPSGGAGQGFLRRHRTYAVLGLLGLMAVGAALVRPGAKLEEMSAAAAAESVAAEDVVGLVEMVVKPAFEKCSVKAENCMSSRCCAVSGLECFQKDATYARCMKACQPGVDGSCLQLAPHTAAVVEEPGSSLFCFSVYTADTGSPKPSYELELLTEQRRRGVSIFSCAAWGVYSDVVAPLGRGASTVKVFDVRGDFHWAKRKETGAWENTGMFVQIWRQIAAEGSWARHNWVVKVDPDAVFFPNKLIGKLSKQTVPKEGVYLENCKYVNYGFFGNLEVFSRQAFSTLLQFMDSCYVSLDWKTGLEGGKWGPMGEDLFAQKCMDAHGVAKLEALSLTADGACEANRPEDQKKNKKWHPPCKGSTTATLHPFKKPGEYFKCLEEAQ